MKRNNLPVVILAGGFGTRLREETEFRPKPMVPVGGNPVLWHIMKIYASYGFYRFIICLGYKGEMIKQYFLNYHLFATDVTVKTRQGSIIEHTGGMEDWEVTLVDTGLDCMTGGRVARIAQYIDTDRFLLTYGDGLADIDCDALLNFHQTHGKMVSVTGVNLVSRFGNLICDGDAVTGFKEKQKSPDDWVSGGFFVCEKEFLSYLSQDASCVLEQEPLARIAAENQLMMYRHNGFWQCMDTYREHMYLEELWQKGAPWKIWHDQERTFQAARKDMMHEATKNDQTQQEKSW